MGHQALLERSQQPGGPANPVSQGRTVKVDTLTGIDLRLPVKWQVVSVFRDQDLGDRCLGRHAALDQPRRCCRLHDRALASPTGVFRTAGHENTELRRDDIETLAHIFANAMKCATAARAGFIGDIDDGLDPRQVGRQRTAVAATMRGTVFLLCRRFLFGFLRGFVLLDIFEAELHLIFGQRFRAPAEAVALQFFDDLKKPFILKALGDEHRLERFIVVGKSVKHSGHRQNKPRAQALGESSFVYKL